jgi:hypothetical protein
VTDGGVGSGDWFGSLFIVRKALRDAPILPSNARPKEKTASNNHRAPSSPELKRIVCFRDDTAKTRSERTFFEPLIRTNRKKDGSNPGEKSRELLLISTHSHRRTYFCRTLQMSHARASVE